MVRSSTIQQKGVAREAFTYGVFVGMAVVAAMVAVMAVPAFAVPSSNSSAQSSVSSYNGDCGPAGQTDNLGQCVKAQNQNPDAFGGPLGQRVSDQPNSGRP